MHPLAFAENRSGANDMKAGDHVFHTLSGRAGIADEFLSDGDALVTWDDGEIDTVKWAHLIGVR